MKIGETESPLSSTKTVALRRQRHFHPPSSRPFCEQPFLTLCHPFPFHQLINLFTSEAVIFRRCYGSHVTLDALDLAPKVPTLRHSEMCLNHNFLWTKTTLSNATNLEPSAQFLASKDHMATHRLIALWPFLANGISIFLKSKEGGENGNKKLHQNIYISL